MPRPATALAAALALAAVVVSSAWTLWLQFGRAPGSPPIARPGPAPGIPLADSPLAATAGTLRDARLALDSGNPGAARAILERAVSDRPKDRELRSRLAETLVALKDFAAAYAHAKAACDLSDGPPAASDAERAALHTDAGTIANAADLADAALAHYLLAQKADPANPRIPLYLGMMHAKRAEETAATAALLTAIGLDPDIAEAWGTLAELSLQAGRNSMAAEQAAKARALQPALLRWRLVEARALKRANQPERAAMLLVGLEPAQRANPAVLEQLCDAYGMLGKPASAAAAALEATTARPHDGAVWYLAGLWAERAGSPDQAARLAAEADRLGDPRARDLLARLAPAAPP